MGCIFFCGHDLHGKNTSLKQILIRYEQKHTSIFCCFLYVFQHFWYILNGRSLIRVVLDHRWQVLPGKSVRKPPQNLGFFEGSNGPFHWRSFPPFFSPRTGPNRRSLSLKLQLGWFFIPMWNQDTLGRVGVGGSLSFHWRLLEEIRPHVSNLNGKACKEIASTPLAISGADVLSDPKSRLRDCWERKHPFSYQLLRAYKKRSFWVSFATVLIKVFWRQYNGDELIKPLKGRLVTPNHHIDTNQTKIYILNIEGWCYTDPFLETWHLDRDWRHVRHVMSSFSWAFCPLNLRLENCPTTMWRRANRRIHP